MTQSLSLGLTFDTNWGTTETELCDIVDNYLIALLDALDSSKEARVSISISANLLTFILQQKKSTTQRLSKLISLGAIELLPTLFSNPLINNSQQNNSSSEFTTMPLNHLKNLVTLYSELASDAGLSLSSIFYMPNNIICPAIINLLHDLGYRYCVLSPISNNTNDSLSYLTAFNANQLTHISTFLSIPTNEATCACSLLFNYTRFANTYKNWLEKLSASTDNTKNNHFPLWVSISNLDLPSQQTATVATNQLIKLFSILINTSIPLSTISEIAPNIPTHKTDAQNKAPHLNKIPLLSPQSAFFKRLSLDFASELIHAPEINLQMSKSLGTNNRLYKAKQHLHALYDSDFYTNATKSHINQSSEFYEHLIRGHVDMEASFYPDVDPNTGWINHKVIDTTSSQGELIVVNSQLMRLYLLPNQGGGIGAFFYKPRKINLCMPTLGSPDNLCATFRLRKIKSSDNSYCSALNKSKALVTRQTLDALYIRFLTPLLIPNADISIASEFRFNAGIGAHLANSTTGLSLEYWIEGDTNNFNSTEDYLIDLTWSILLPCATPDALSLSSLQCVGGVSKSTVSMAEQQTIKNSDVEGGLYGARLIDGLQSLVIDLRTSKPLTEMQISPLFIAKSNIEKSSKAQTENTYYGTTLRLTSSLKRLKDSASPITAFLSIV